MKRQDAKTPSLSSLLFLALLLSLPSHAAKGAGQDTAAPAEAAAQALQKAKAEAARLKDDWDKARLETTLYDQRAKRAYKHWLNAKSKARDQALRDKERAELELKLSVEKRKLAWNRWEAAQFRATARESEWKALEDEKDSADIEKEIHGLEAKLKADPKPH